jgi:hypothetical protein
MSAQKIMDEVMSALWWILVGASLSLFYRFHNPNPEKVFIEKICVTVNGQEYCK